MCASFAVVHIEVSKDLEHGGFVAHLEVGEASYWGETLDDLAYTMVDQFQVVLRALRALGYPNLGIVAEQSWSDLVETVIEEARKRLLDE